MCIYRCNQKIPTAVALGLFTWQVDCATKFQVVSSRTYFTPLCFLRALTCSLQLRQAEKARSDNGVCFALRIQSPIEVAYEPLTLHMTK